MSAPRPKVTIHLDDADHRALKVLADAESLSQQEWAERIIKSAISVRVGEVSVLANALQRAGIISNSPQSAATTGRPHK